MIRMGGKPCCDRSDWPSYNGKSQRRKANNPNRDDKSKAFEEIIKLPIDARAKTGTKIKIQGQLENLSL